MNKFTEGSKVKLIVEATHSPDGKSYVFDMTVKSTGKRLYLNETLDAFFMNGNSCGAGKPSRVMDAAQYDADVDVWLRDNPHVGMLNNGKFYVYHDRWGYKEVAVFTKF